MYPSQNVVHSTTGGGHSLPPSTYDRMAPKHVRVLIPGACEYVLLRGKEELRLQMELSLLILRREIVLDYAGGPV